MKIRFAYQAAGLFNLWQLKECKAWWKEGWLDESQYRAISTVYSSPFYHPNVMIRLLLFFATLFALSGVTGFVALVFDDLPEDFIFFGCVLYGLASWVVVEKLFIARHHYKSGVNEALIYHGCGFCIGGMAGIFDGNEHILLLSATVVFVWAAFRYLDVVCTICAAAAWAGFLFYELYTIVALRTFIPLIFLIAFTPVYWLCRRAKLREGLAAWHTQFVWLETLSLLVMYAAGNYLVIRMLSEHLLDLQLEAGQDIPLAPVFYFTTVAIPVLYLYFGIRRKDVVLLRVSLLVIAFSVFTFKYYFSLGHPEITLTVAGAFVLLITFGLLRYLKTMRHGYTREALRSSRWAALHAEALVISQTLGGTHAPGKNFGGGTSGGGGAQTSF